MTRGRWQVAAGIAFAAGILLGFVLSRFETLKRLDIKDVLGPAATLTAALVIGRYVQTQLRNENLLHGIVAEVVKTASDAVSKSLVAWEKYVTAENRTQDMQNDVVRSLEAVSLSLRDFEDLEARGAFSSGVVNHQGLLAQFFKLKRAMTDTPFAASSGTFSPERLEEARKIEQDIRRQLFRSRVDLVR